MLERACDLLPLLPLPLLLAGGCTVTDLGTLDRLEAAYGDETASLAGPGLLAATALAGLSAEACLSLDDGGWAALSEGDSLPLSADLDAVLGGPTVRSITVEGDGAGGDTVDLTVGGVALLGRQDLSLALTVVDASPVLVSATGTADDAVVLTADLEVAAGCSEERSRVSGDVSLFGEDLDATVLLPAPDAEVEGVDYAGLTAWLPAAGSLRWSTTLDGVQRTVRTDDASVITLAGETATWPATAAGGETANEAGWSAEVEVELAP